VDYGFGSFKLPQFYYVPPALTFKNFAILSHAVSYGSQKKLRLVS